MKRLATGWKTQKIKKKNNCVRSRKYFLESSDWEMLAQKISKFFKKSIPSVVHF